MKHVLLLKTMLLGMLFPVCLFAQSGGYILYGSGPDGYANLTSKVNAAAVGSAAFDAGVFTGAGLPGRICESGNYLQLAFAETQTLTLSDSYALHIVVQKAEAAAGNLQLSFCRNGWNAARTSWEISNALIASDEPSHIVLRYSARNTDNWNSYEESTLIGEVEYPAAEIMRICAANGEAFTILGIYLEVACEEEQGGDPVVEGSVRYYLYRGNNSDALPVIEEVTCVDVRPATNASVACNSAAQDNTVTDFTQFTVNGSWCAIDHKPTAAVANKIDNTYYLIVRFRTNLANEAVSGNKLRFNLSNGAANFYINNSDETAYNDGKWHIVTLPIADAAGTKPSAYLAANQIAFQIHLDGNGEAGRIISIDYAYFTNDISALDEGTAEGSPLPTEVRSVHETVCAKKQLRNGQVVIQRGTAVYDLYGRKLY